MGWMAPLRHLGAKILAGWRPAANGEPSMGEITTTGLDLAKHVFQVHGVDAEGATVLRKQLRRGQILAFWHSRSIRRNRDKPAVSSGHRSRSNDEDSVRGTHQGQQSVRTASTGRTHDCKRPQCCTPNYLLPGGGHPHMTASDRNAARQIISCQAGAIHT